MSIRFKLLFAFGLIGALAVGLAAYAVHQVNSLGQLVVQTYDGPLMGINYARSANSRFNALAGQVIRAQLRQNPDLAATAKLLKTATGEIESDLNVVRDRVTEAGVREGLARARTALGAWAATEIAHMAPPKEGVAELPAPWIAERQAKDVAAALDDVVELVAAYGFEFRSNAEEQLATINRVLMWLAAGTGAVSLLLALLFATSLARPILRMRDAIAALLRGERVVIPGVKRRDELGQLARSLMTIYESGVETARIRSALDSCRTNAMAIDTDMRVVYLNESLRALFEAHAADFRSETAGFDPASMINAPLAEVLPAEHMADLASGVQKRLTIGTRTIDITSSTVTTETGEPLGAVLEWRDVTDELADQAEMAELATTTAAAAAAGDFSRRIPLGDKQGFMRDMAVAINEIGTVVEHVTDELATTLQAIAEGDLTQRVTGSHQGRFAVIKDAVNETANRLSDAVSTIQSSAAEVTRAAREITVGANDLSSRTEHQASSLEEAAATTEELSASVKSSTQASKEAAALAGQASGIATNAGKVARDAIDAMVRIEKASHEISDINSVIGGIAFQTNLLALNAAVEAARAGDAGAGFSVVAAEVRVLAQRASEAAKNIGSLIDRSNGEIAEGVGLVRATGEALDKIVGASQKVATTISEIATASMEQEHGIGEISQVVAGIDEMTQQNSALAEQTAASAESLQSNIGRLNGLVATFRTGKERADHAAKPNSWVPEPLRLSA